PRPACADDLHGSDQCRRPEQAEAEGTVPRGVLTDSVDYARSFGRAAKKCKRMRWFIAIRYFLSHKRQSVVCIAGVTISVTMFLSMTSMMDGLTEKFIVETVESSGPITLRDEARE